ncbi:uncharacterized protein LOC135848412 [Planococcus citri]|uniref:uncharacterized protein LOC135848412 n=1 Tax=Planococcus citri TaxID=170843 RepID=UPI0031FA1FDE
MAVKIFDHFIDLFLLTMGVLENPEYKKFGIPFFIVYFGFIIVDTFGMMVGVATTDDLIRIAIQFGQLTTQLNCIAMMTYYKISMTLVLELIAKLRENSSKWLEAEPIMEQFMRSVILKVFIGYYVAIIFTVAPVLAGQFNSVEVSEKYSYVTPFWYSCGTLEHSVFRHVCWNVETHFELFWSNIAQAFLYYCTLHALIMLLLFYTILTFNVKIHAQVLTKKSEQLANDTYLFIELNSRNSGDNFVRMRNEFDRDILLKFLELLKHQQFIREFAIEVTRLVHWMVMINVTGIFCALSMTAFFTIVEKTNDSLLASKMATMSIVMIVTLFIYCYNAQMISDLGPTIMDNMLDIPWYLQSLRFRKTFAIALCLNQNLVMTVRSTYSWQ